LLLLNCSCYFTAIYIVYGFVYGFVYFTGDAIHIPTRIYGAYGFVMNLCLIKTTRDLSLQYTVSVYELGVRPSAG
jgi:hypothetical protein